MRLIFSDGEHSRKVVDIGNDGAIQVHYQHHEIRIDADGDSEYTDRWLPDFDSGATLDFEELKQVYEAAKDWIK